MVSKNSKIEKFNFHNFDFWNLKMGYLLIEREKKEVVIKDTKSDIMKQEDWGKMNYKATTFTVFNLFDFALMQLSKETKENKL